MVWQPIIYRDFGFNTTKNCTGVAKISIFTTDISLYCHKLGKETAVF